MSAIILRDKIILLFIVLTFFSCQDREVAGNLSVATTETKQHLFLADSPWPISHGSPYAQGSSKLPGPTSAAQISPKLTPVSPVAITLAVSGEYPNGGRAIWGNTLTEVFKIDPQTTRVIGKKDKKTIISEEAESSDLSGAYAFVDNNNQFFFPMGRKIVKVIDTDPGALESAFQFKSIDIGKNWLEGEVIVGFNLAYSGQIIYLTSHGKLGLVDRTLAIETHKFIQIEEDDNTPQVSNSFAVDESGGIFLLSAKKAYRYDLNSEFSLTETWSVNYRTSDVLLPGRLGVGSGTTPSLMGSASEKDSFMVFADGANPMNFVALWRAKEIPDDWPGLANQERRFAGNIPITFGFEEPKNSVTEQSLLVSGHGVVAVSNTYRGRPGILLRLVITAVSRNRFGRRLSSNEQLIAVSNDPKIAPYGVEKFGWDSTLRKFTSVWTNKAISCPNGIPTMSAASQLMYCIGQRPPSVDQGLHQWTIEALDWNTGESKFFVPINPDQTRQNIRERQMNSFYSGLGIVQPGTLASGVLGGVMFSTE